MIDLHILLRVADAYKFAAGIESDTTVSHRVFGDSKKLGALRGGADITVSRFNVALAWFDENWPRDRPRPEELAASADREGSEA